MVNSGEVVWIDTLPSARGWGAELAKQAAGAGSRAGAQISRELERSAGDAGRRAGTALGTGIEAAKENVKKVAGELEAARNREAELRRRNDRRIVTRPASTRALIGQATVQMVGDKGADGQLQPARLRALARVLANVSGSLTREPMKSAVRRRASHLAVLLLSVHQRRSGCECRSGRG